MMGQTLLYLAPNSHEAQYEVDVGVVGVVGVIDHSQLLSDEHHHGALTQWNDSKSELAEKDNVIAWKATEPT